VTRSARGRAAETRRCSPACRRWRRPGPSTGTGSHGSGAEGAAPGWVAPWSRVRAGGDRSDCWHHAGLGSGSVGLTRAPDVRIAELPCQATLEAASKVAILFVRITSDLDALEFAAVPFVTGCHRLRPLGPINAPYARLAVASASYPRPPCSVVRLVPRPLDLLLAYVVGRRVAPSTTEAGRRAARELSPRATPARRP
jgi:hypothetical protein